MRDIGRTSQQLSLLEADRHRARRRARGGLRARDQQPADVGAAQPALAAQAARRAPARSRRSRRRCAASTTSRPAPSGSRATCARCRRSRRAARPQSIDLAAVVSSALRLAAPTLEPRAHVIRQIFPVAPVIGEESRIGQAVLAMMLFSSSGLRHRDATAATNRIVVAVEERARDVVVEVSDNGRDLTAEESAARVRSVLPLVGARRRRRRRARRRALGRRHARRRGHARAAPGRRRGDHDAAAAGAAGCIRVTRRPATAAARARRRENTRLQRRRTDADRTVERPRW